MAGREKTATLAGRGEGDGSAAHGGAVVGAEASNLHVEAYPRDEGQYSDGARFWLIIGSRRGEPRTLFLGPFGGEGAVPVFSSREEAVAFLHVRGPLPGGWRVEGVRTRRLLSRLADPSLSSVRTVVLDPIPEVPAGVSTALVGVDKGRFAERLLEHPTGSCRTLSPARSERSR